MALERTKHFNGLFISRITLGVIVDQQTQWVQVWMDTFIVVICTFWECWGEIVSGRNISRVVLWIRHRWYLCLKPLCIAMNRSAAQLPMFGCVLVSFSIECTTTGEPLVNRCVHVFICWFLAGQLNFLQHYFIINVCLIAPDTLSSMSITSQIIF